MVSPIDLRSDTITRPTPAMRQAMTRAEVGDDVFGEDPTVNALQERCAHLFDKEASLFVPTGTMANQTAIRAHTQSGDEIIIHAASHTYMMEAAGPASLSGCSLALVNTPDGIFTGDAIRPLVRPDDVHYARSRLVVIENTHNRAGGTVWPIESVASVAAAAHTLGLSLHMDGARLMNACVALGCKPTDYTRHVDSTTLCFSKGLGAPVGSIVAGPRDLIKKVHRFRKMFGGGMRQAGILAAAALYALDHHVQRLAEDHENAKRLAYALAGMKHVRLDPTRVQTNIIIFELGEGRPPAGQVCKLLAAHGVLVLSAGPNRVRAVTHLDVSRQQIEQAIPRFAEVLDRWTAPWTSPARTAAEPAGVR